MTWGRTDERPLIERFIWELTYACPLRCIHCMNESGRRRSHALGRDDALRVADVIASAGPQRVSISGGEPLLMKWVFEACHRLVQAEIPVTMFTSGWLMDAHKATQLSGAVSSVAVSLDGSNAAIHDIVRGRVGSFDKTMRALDVLTRVKRERSSGEPAYSIGIDYTVTQTGLHHLDSFVRDITRRFPDIDFVRFGAVVPVGLAQEESFVNNELLSYDQLVTLAGAEAQLASYAESNAEVTVTDIRYFLPNEPLGYASASIAHIEPDGQLRAFTNYEAKTGNVLEEPLDLLWDRALEWRADPFVGELMDGIRTVEDWARVTRILDRRYGSPEDQLRLSRRALAPS